MDERGKPLFSEMHLEAIRRIKRLVLEDGVTLDEAKRAVRAGEAPPGPAHDDRASEGELRALIAGLARTLDEMGRLLTRLQEDILRHGKELEQSREEIRYIVEENSALQELVARLVERVDALSGPEPGALDRQAAHGPGEARGLPAATPAFPEAAGASRAPHRIHEFFPPADHGRILASSAQAGPSPAILPWRPESLGRAGAHVHDAKLNLN